MSQSIREWRKVTRNGQLISQINAVNYTTEIPVDYHQSRQQVPNKAGCVGSEHRWQRPPKHETLLQRPWGQLRILPGPWRPCALTPVSLQRQKNDLRPRTEINLWSHETWRKHSQARRWSLWRLPYLPPLTLQHVQFPHDPDRGCGSITGICVQWLVYLRDFSCSPTNRSWPEGGLS